MVIVQKCNNYLRTYTQENLWRRRTTARWERCLGGGDEKGLGDDAERTGRWQADKEVMGGTVH